MLEEFKKNLIATCLCSADQHFLLTVSGGVDSVVMTHLFHAGGYKFSLAHCNFQLRGEASTGDQQYVEALAAEMGVPCHIKSFETTAYAKQNRISIQMAARDLRYSWFEELAEKHGYENIAVGHNKNDIIETALLNLSRGTGIRGLMGIRPRHDKIIRPLLFASRQEILKYAGNHGLQWREDDSNNETKYHRNKIRHTIIPAFETINPAFMQNAVDTIGRLEQTGKLLDYTLALVKKEVWHELPDRTLINIEKLKEYPANGILLFELLREFGISQLSMDSVLGTLVSISGKQFHTRTHIITRDRLHLIITRKAVTVESEMLIETDTALLDYPIHLNIRTIEVSAGFKIPIEHNFATLDANRITYPLKLRNWKEGDRFYPLGLPGSKKVSDFLINNKIPLPDKQFVWILESGGKIVWIVNHRIDDRFKITDSTSKILLIEYKE
jgi:tRNA(Ile)-lysidine synthase